MSRRYNIETIRSLMADPRNVEAVIHDLYGTDAQKEKTEYFVSDVAGGSGRSCQFQTTGRYAGRFRDFNPSGTKEQGDLIDAVQIVRGCSTAEAIQYLGDLWGAEPRLSAVPSSRPEPKAPQDDDLKEISAETLRKHRSRLTEDSPAWSYLEGRGLDVRILKDRFGIGVAGLFKPQKEGEIARGNWINVPVMRRDGALLKRMMKIAVPGFSVNPIDSNSWCPGSPITTWNGPADQKPWLFVAEGVKDLWRIQEAIRGSSLDVRMAIISSTHGSAIPEEWSDPDFWAPWERVFLGHDNDAAGEKMAGNVRALARREFHRVDVPRVTGKDWTDFFEADARKRSVEDFEELLKNARPLGIPAPQAAPAVPLSDQTDGIYEDRRININGAFVNGQMYYPFQVRRVETVRRKRTLPDGSSIMVPEKASFYETRVVRSDGAMLGMSQAPAPHGVDDEDRVTLLDDGTEVLSLPRPREYSTWAWPSIQRFVEASVSGDPTHRPLKQIIRDIQGYLRKLTWLPNEHDYDLLAAYTVMTYCYNGFDAIPLILLNGEKGSGKSSLAEGLADLSFNGYMLGGGSEKAFVRFVDQGRGMLVLDDLEAVGRRSQDDSGYGDINQILKVSYSKSTGLKTIVEKNGSTRTLNFYGPKVITNISGIDAVNATRMYQIICRPMPDAVKDSGRIRGRDLRISEPLRQELHAWGMSNIAEAHRLYREKMSSRAGRAEQIAAPLETIADMTGDDEFRSVVRSAIKRLAYSAAENLSAEDHLVQAVESAIERGVRHVISLAQIQAELALIPDAQTLQQPSQVSADLLPLQDPASIGRMLKSLGIRSQHGGRARLSGQVIRYYDLDPSFVEGVLERAAKESRHIMPHYPITSAEPARRAFAFCETKMCGSCPYTTICDAALPGIRNGKP